MKLKYLRILAVTVTALTLSACEKDDIDPESGKIAPVFTAKIEDVRTRVNGTSWEPEDEIGISYGLTTSSVFNVCHVISNAEGELTAKSPENKIYFMSTTLTNTMIFNAYYPFVNIEKPSTTNKYIQVDTSDQTKQDTFDFLFAKATGTKQSAAVDFNFTHKMSKVTLVFKNGNGFDVSNIVSYSLGQVSTTGRFSITDGGFTTLQNKSTVGVNLTEVKNGQPVTPLILIPQTGLSNVKLEVHSRANQTFSVILTFPENKLVAGENYKFGVTVSRTGLTVSECTIDDWNDYWPEGSGVGTADSADDPDE